MATVLTTRFPRQERKAILLGLRTVQLVMLATAVVSGAIALLTRAPNPARVTLVAISVALGVVATARVESMPAYRWLLLRAAHAVRRQRRQDSFRARPLRSTGPIPEGKPPRGGKPTREGQLRLPGTAAALRVLQHSGGHGSGLGGGQGGGLGVVHDPYRRRLTAVARITSPAHLLLGTQEQDRRVAEYGRLIAGLCQGGRIVRAQIVERTLPDSGNELTAWAKLRGLDPATANTPNTPNTPNTSKTSNTLSTLPGVIYCDLLEHAAPASARHETLFGFSVDLTAMSVSREARKHGGGLVGAVAVLESETRVFQTALAAAGVSGYWLSARQIAAALRPAFDPAAVRAVDRIGSELDPNAAGPLAVDAEWDHLRTDSSFHRVYQVDEWPRVQTGSGFLSPLLLKPGIRRTFSIVLQPIPIARALRDARRDQVERVTDRSTRNRIGQLETEHDRQVDADVAQREKDLAAGHGDVRWVGLLVVSADRLDLLDDASAQIEVAASQALLDLRRLVGQQAEAFLAAVLPLGTGLE